MLAGCLYVAFVYTYLYVYAMFSQNIEREKYFKVTLVPVESFSPASYALIIYKGNVSR